jgi:hypothetical protein
MLNILGYIERTIEELTGKTAEEIRRDYITNSPLDKHYQKLHMQDAEKGIVRLIDGTTVKVSF